MHQRRGSRSAYGQDTSGRQPGRTAPRTARDRAPIVALVLFATVAAFGLVCQSSLASTRAPIAAPGAPIAAPGASTAASSTPTFSSAPLSPAYTRYLKLRSLSRSRLGRGVHGLGYIPSPIDFSYLGRAGVRFGTLGASYPRAFDLRTLGRLSAIEDQGQTGCCWTFATMGSLESGLLPSDPESFSEDNLALNSGFDSALAGTDSAYNSGGNALMSTAYLARWAGPVLASQDAFDDSYTPPGLTAAKHVQDVLYLPPRTSWSDNGAIKAAVMSYGAVYTSMYADDGMCSDADSQYYNADNASYYCDGAPGQQDHAVDIVGWNDNYAASNFSSDGVTDQPPGNGAFIVRNSWGTVWGGDAGYFYVSYYDTNFAYDVNAAFDDAESAGNYNGIYQYDPLGWTTSLGYSNDTTAWFANDFPATSSDEVAAVGFYAVEPGTTYTVYAGATLQSLTARGSGTLQMGYHTVHLSSPLPLTSGQDFVVAVKVTTPGYCYPIPLEYPDPGYGTSTATAAPGQSFVSSDGSTWSDLTDDADYADTNVCLKAFTRPAGSDETAPTTTVIPANKYELGYWNNTPCDFAFTAADNAGGSGVDTTQYDLDSQGWTLWDSGVTFTVPAPADHTNDGQHTFLVRSTDVTGNTETPQSFSLAIDTRRPSSKAPYAAHVRRGSYATLKFEVLDTAPCYGRCLAGITVETLKGAHRLTLSPTTWYKCGKVVSYRFKCKLARGKYRFYVTTWDGATNKSAKTSANYLTVT